MKENGGLPKLVAYITDTTPPEEEDTKNKGKKGGEKGASRAGKKGKGDDGKLFINNHQPLVICFQFWTCILDIILSFHTHIKYGYLGYGVMYDIFPKSMLSSYLITTCLL